jgi:uncharacterized protein DUF6361
MTSHLAWLDHDSTARDRMQRILALFKNKEARDELGLGTIRDSIADQLFPGTSTIQTRLRYMLFVPWIYQRLEAERVSSGDVARKARKLETQLLDSLLTQEDQDGIFGKRARGEIKRLPSSVYWAGLESWGIRRFPGSQEEYHRAFDAIARGGRAREQLREDVEAPRLRQETWHPTLPGCPEGFPDHAAIALTYDEATWIQARIVELHDGTVLGLLAKDGVPDGVEAPWELSDRPRITPHNRLRLEHGRRFSSAMKGAALLYNYALAVRPDGEGRPRWHTRAVELEALLREWCAELDTGDLQRWTLAEFWDVARTHGHVVTPATRAFVEAWVDVARRGEMNAVLRRDAIDLVSKREMRLKGPRSRFVNEAAYKDWGGAAGVGAAVYRWPTARVLLADLHAGLEAR